MLFDVFCVNSRLLEDNAVSKSFSLRVSESFMAHMMRIYDKTRHLRTTLRSSSMQTTLKGSIIPMSGFSYNVWCKPNNFESRHTYILYKKTRKFIDTVRNEMNTLLIIIYYFYIRLYVKHCLFIWIYMVEMWRSWWISSQLHYVRQRILLVHLMCIQYRSFFRREKVHVAILVVF